VGGKSGSKGCKLSERPKVLQERRLTGRAPSAKRRQREIGRRWILRKTGKVTGNRQERRPRAHRFEGGCSEKRGAAKKIRLQKASSERKGEPSKGRACKIRREGETRVMLFGDLPPALKGNLVWSEERDGDQE